MAEQVRVGRTEGVLHGFLAVRTVEGKMLADGELTQFAEGDLVKSHLIFRFKDGSLYEEAAMFTQHGTFRLRSDHVAQKGPSFKHPLETSVDVATGRVVVHYTDDEGKEQTIDERLSLPEDVANGLLFTLVRHIQPSVPQTVVSQVAMTPKPRLVELEILPQGEEPFSSGSTRYKAVHYVVKVKIGGVAGLLAPLLGKKPADMHIWIKPGEAPAFVKFEGPLYNGGPIWSSRIRQDFLRPSEARPGMEILPSGLLETSKISKKHSIDASDPTALLITIAREALMQDLARHSTQRFMLLR